MRKAAFSKLLSLAKENPNIFLVASDLGEDVVAGFQNAVPKQLLLQGIAEGHSVGVAAGLASQGAIVFVNTIASFLTRRAFDQIAINLSVENANVKLLGQGGGLLYGGQGPTHHAVEDIAIMRTLPNIQIILPCDVEQTALAIELATNTPGPFYIRLAKGSARTISTGYDLKLDQAIVYRSPGDVLIIANGIMTQTALEVSNRLADLQIKCGVIQVPFMKPFCFEELAKHIDQSKFVFTLEEHSEVGGLGACVGETIARYADTKPAFKMFSLGDQVIRAYGKQEELLALLGLDSETVTGSILSVLSKRSVK